MATTLENLIDLPLLTYYDGKIKPWVQAQIANGTVFTSTSSLPTTGKAGVLYITETSIKYWDDTQKKYIDVGGTSDPGESTTWGDF